MTTQAQDMNFLQNVDMTWLTDGLQRLLKNDRSPLQLYCWAKRIEEKMAEIMGALRIPANAEFVQMRDASTKFTKWACEEFAVLTNNAARGTWSYTPELMAKQAEIDELIKQFQATHKKTHYVEGQLDASRTPLFKVSIMK